MLAPFSELIAAHPIAVTTLLIERLHLFCLMPSWPQRRVLELAPASWRKILAQSDTQQLLRANVYRRASIAPIEDPPPLADAGR